MLPIINSILQAKEIELNIGWTEQDLRLIERIFIESKVVIHDNFDIHFIDSGIFSLNTSTKAVILFNNVPSLDVEHVVIYSDEMDSLALFRKRFPTHDIIQFIPYALVENNYQLIEYVKYLFTSTQHCDIFSSTIFESRYDLTIDVDKNLVQSFFRKHSPFTPFCGSFGFVASTTNRMSVFTRKTVSPILGVTGYVEYIRNGENDSFIPIVHISEMLMTLPISCPLALIIPLIVDIVIIRQLWKANATIDDLRLLLTSVKGAAHLSVTEENFAHIFDQYIDPPMLCFDIDRTSNSYFGGLTNRANGLFRKINHFYEIGNEEHFSCDNLLTESLIKEVVGLVIPNDNEHSVIDTRDVTYQYLVNRFGYRPEFEEMLRYNSNPIERFSMIQRFFKDHATVIPTRCFVVSKIEHNQLRHIHELFRNNIRMELPADICSL